MPCFLQRKREATKRHQQQRKKKAPTRQSWCAPCLFFEFVVAVSLRCYRVSSGLHNMLLLVAFQTFWSRIFKIGPLGAGGFGGGKRSWACLRLELNDEITTLKKSTRRWGVGGGGGSAKSKKEWAVKAENDILQTSTGRWGVGRGETVGPLSKLPNWQCPCFGLELKDSITTSKGSTGRGGQGGGSTLLP